MNIYLILLHMYRITQLLHAIYTTNVLKQLNTHYVSIPGSGRGLDSSLGSPPALSSVLPYPIGQPLQNWSLLG